MTPYSRGEIIDIGKGQFQFEWPRPSNCVIGILFLLMFILGFRGAGYVADKVVNLFATVDFLPEGYRRNVGWGGVFLIAVNWFLFISVLFLLSGVIAHLSKRIHLRLTRKGMLTAWGALGIWYLGIMFLAVMAMSKTITIFWVKMASTVAGLFLLGKGAHTFVFARRHMSADADTVMKQDKRPPILYLRSFHRDGSFSSLEMYNRAQLETFDLRLDHIFLPSFYTGRRHLTFEEVICKGLGTIGPVVAIGQPGEILPQIGASRKYVGDDTWQEEVTKLIRRSKFTSILVDKSDGLNWEFRQLLKYNRPEKTLLLIPPLTAYNYTHWAIFISKHPQQVEQGILPKQLPSDPLAIIFKDNWRPVIFVGQPTIGSYRKIGRYLNKRSGS